MNCKQKHVIARSAATLITNDLGLLYIYKPIIAKSYSNYLHFAVVVKFFFLLIIQVEFFGGIFP